MISYQSIQGKSLKCGRCKEWILACPVGHWQQLRRNLLYPVRLLPLAPKEFQRHIDIALGGRHEVVPIFYDILIYRETKAEAIENQD